jgi:hypothetical protein
VTVSTGTVATTTTLPLQTTIVTSTVAAVPTCTASGSNLIQNSGFESGLTGWSQRVKTGNSGPAVMGITGGGNSGTSAYRVTASNSGTFTILSQQLSGLTKGVRYTFGFKFSYQHPNPSSISCSLSSEGTPWTVLTNNEGRINSWLTSPSSTFVAKESTGVLECNFVASGVQLFRIDDLYLGC